MARSRDDPQQDHFDPDTYLEMVMAEVPAYVDLQRETARATQGIVTRQILDLGIGTGETLARVLAEHPNAGVVGIDESEGMIGRARERFPDADLRIGQLEGPLPAGSYDLIVSALAIHHLDGAGKAALFLRVAEGLRPGGRFVMADVVIPEDPGDVVTPVDGTYDQPSRVDEQLQWLQDAGLRPIVTWSQNDLAVIAADRP